MSPVSLRVPIAKGLKLAKVHRVTKSDPTFSPSQHAEAKHTLSRQYFAFVTAARKDALATSGAPKVETATSAVEACTREAELGPRLPLHGLLSRAVHYLVAKGLRRTAQGGGLL